jgi:seryl-tRNA synthetase
LIVADDIGSIRSRGAQFEAYLLDIDHLSAVAEKSADMISLKSATDAIADVTEVVKGLKDVKKELGKGDVDVDAAAKAIQNLIDRLVKVRDDVNALGNA